MKTKEYKGLSLSLLRAINDMKNGHNLGTDVFSTHGYLAIGFLQSLVDDGFTAQELLWVVEKPYKWNKEFLAWLIIEFEKNEIL